MLRLIRLSYPNSIRGKIFTEFAMETARDSIKYIRPVYTNSQKDQFDGKSGDSTNTMNNRTFNDNFNLDAGYETGFADINYRKAMYESTESRYATEMVNAAATVTSGVATVSFSSGAFGASGANYIDGYSSVYLNNEQHPLAIQSRNGDWFYGNIVKVSSNLWVKVTAVDTTTLTAPEFTLSASVNEGSTWVTGASVDLGDNTVVAMGRFDSEGDLTGQYLGEVELVMTDYQFRPRPLSLGVTWTQLTELVLDTSFGVSAEEMLLDADGQESKTALDFNAVKYGYAMAKAHAGDQIVKFNAEAGAQTDDSYFHTAQLIGQAIARIGDIQLNRINRGGVSRIVGGPAAITYLMLNKGFKSTGKQDPIGGHQVGELDGIPIFKVPSSIIPDNELLTTWKNTQNESDVSIAFGTLLPFWTSGSIQRKNLYKEAAIARFEDVQALNPKYLGRIVIDGIRELNP